MGNHTGPSGEYQDRPTGVNDGCRPWNPQQEISATETRIKAELHVLHKRVAQIEHTQGQLIRGFEALIVAVGELLRRGHHVPVVESLNLHEVR